MTTPRKRIRPSSAYPPHREAIRAVIEANRVDPRIFGSTARDEDTEVSDLDILIDVTPATSLFDAGAMIYLLSNLRGVPVDVVLTNGMPERIKKEVLSEAIPL